LSRWSLSFRETEADRRDNSLVAIDPLPYNPGVEGIPPKHLI
jgi:hypothetical protein